MWNKGASAGDSLAVVSDPRPMANAGREEKLTLRPMAAGRPEHSPDTCRLYRCQMCAAIKGH